MAKFEQRLDNYNGLAGYDPLPVLTRSRTPTLWLYGERDLDIPARRSAKIIANLQAKASPFTVKVYPDGDHNLQDHTTGSQLKYWPDVIDWLRRQQFLK
jgi:pimeloyl-ACP methyl ester carboxylesterase